MAFIATALPFISAIGTVLSAGAAIRGGVVQRDQAEANAAIITRAAERDAEIDRLATAREAELLERERRQALGRQIALRGASGVQISEGSPLLTATETINNMYEDLAYLEAGGTLRQQSILGSASDAAEIELARGDDAFATGLIRGGSLITQGLSSAAGGSLLRRARPVSTATPVGGGGLIAGTGLGTVNFAT